MSRSVSGRMSFVVVEGNVMGGLGRVGKVSIIIIAKSLLQKIYMRSRLV